MEEQDEYKRFRSSGAAASEEKSHQPYENGNHCDDYGMDACLTVAIDPSDGARCARLSSSKETGESGTDNRFAKYSGFRKCAGCGYRKQWAGDTEICLR